MFSICNLVDYAGKGDLVGCDISQHLATCSNGQGGEGRHGAGGSQDHVIVKSSSDVKVMYFGVCARTVRISYILTRNE